MNETKQVKQREAWRGLDSTITDLYVGHNDNETLEVRSHVDKGQTLFAAIDTGDDDLDLAAANLFTASPKMLQACRVAVSVLRDSPREIDKAALSEIRSAIDEATGN